MTLAAPASFAAVASTPTTAALVKTRRCDSRRSVAWAVPTSARYHTRPDVPPLWKLRHLHGDLIARNRPEVPAFMATFGKLDGRRIPVKVDQEIRAGGQSGLQFFPGGYQVIPWRQPLKLIPAVLIGAGLPGAARRRSVGSLRPHCDDHTGQRFAFVILDRSREVGGF